jgi:hypothetical protein
VFSRNEQKEVGTLGSCDKKEQEVCIAAELAAVQP